MKKVLIIFAVFLVLIVSVPLIVALFMPTDFTVERTVEIDRPKDEVFEFVKYLRNQDQFSRWGSLDPNMRQEYRGTDGTVGFVAAWEGNEDVGKGEQEITAIEEGRRIETRIQFIEPFESRADAYMITEEIGERQTRVIWGFESSFPRPMNLLLAVMNIDEAIGDDFEEGLTNLKTIMEAEPEPEEQES